MAERRLYRSQTNKMIGGVCGGIAEYYNLDPTLVRIAWIVLSVLPLIPGLIVYVIAWIVIPKNPSQSPTGKSKNSISSAAFFGFFFIAVGSLLLLENLGIFDWGEWWHFSWEFMLPLILIGAGILLLVRPRLTDERPVEGAAASKKGKASAVRTLRRSRSDRKVLGVCGGLASYFNVDPSLIRIGFVFFSLWPFGLGVLLYLLMGLIIPEESSSRAETATSA